MNPSCPDPHSPHPRGGADSATSCTSSPCPTTGDALTARKALPGVLLFRGVLQGLMLLLWWQVFSSHPYLFPHPWGTCLIWLLLLSREKLCFHSGAAREQSCCWCCFEKSVEDPPEQTPLRTALGATLQKMHFLGPGSASHHQHQSTACPGLVLSVCCDFVPPTTHLVCINNVDPARSGVWSLPSLLPRY